jgi:hypothetical protein
MHGIAAVLIRILMRRWPPRACGRGEFWSSAVQEDQGAWKGLDRGIAGLRWRRHELIEISGDGAVVDPCRVEELPKPMSRGGWLIGLLWIGL